MSKDSKQSSLFPFGPPIYKRSGPTIDHKMGGGESNSSIGGLFYQSHQNKPTKAYPNALYNICRIIQMPQCQQKLKFYTFYDFYSQAPEV